MSERKHKYIFGPVWSRRLGRSLGVDLVPLKACPFDCIYCQLGATTDKTLRRAEYVPTQAVLTEIAERLSGDPACCDAVTLSGSGEPTLHSGIDRIIAGIKAVTKVPVVVLTNGALLGDPEVRRALAQADVVCPDLDAGDEETFQRINRPCAGITLQSVVAGLKTLRKEFAGMLAVEVFLVAGVNDGEQQVRKIRALLDEIKPDRIDVNTVARPPAEKDARAVDAQRLARLCAMLGPKASVLASAPPVAPPARGVSAEDVLAAVRRHPSTAEDLAAGLQCPQAEVARILKQLLHQGSVTIRQQGGREYYHAAGQSQ